MDKLKRILALITVFIIAICIILTLVFAILAGHSDNPFYDNAWKASAFCMILLPIFIWVMFWIYNLLRGRGVKQDKTEEVEEKTEEKIEE